MLLKIIVNEDIQELIEACKEEPGIESLYQFKSEKSDTTNLCFVINDDQSLSEEDAHIPSYLTSDRGNKFAVIGIKKADMEKITIPRGWGTWSEANLLWEKPAK